MKSNSWTIATAIVAAILFATAISHAVYDVTSPKALSWHIVLRKIYSVVAFALVGYLARRALAERGIRGRSVATCVLGVAAYSGAIEVGQYLYGTREGLGWNAFDVGCGAFGGALATIDLIVRRPVARP